MLILHIAAGNAGINETKIENRMSSIAGADVRTVVEVAMHSADTACDKHLNTNHMSG